MNCIPDDLFYREICPYLSPSAMRNVCLLGYQHSIVKFLKRKHLRMEQIEDLTCPCCGCWLFEEWYEMNELDLDHFDGFFTSHRYYTEEGRYHWIVWYFKQSNRKERRRVVLCRMCQLKTYCRTKIICFPHAGTRDYKYSTKYGILYYTKKNDNIVYWDEANFNYCIINE